MKMNINMKKIVFYSAGSIRYLRAFAQEATIKEAEVAYTKEDYGKAIELYEGLLKTHGESAEIYYNLGNAYYKENKIAPTILNYERALLLDPGDGDIRFNLQLARQKSVDKIEPVGDFFLHRWFDKVQNMGAADSWAQIGIVCFILFIGCLILFFFSKWIRFEEDRVLSGAGILGVGHLCQYLCRQPEGRADKPEERDRVCSDSDSEKFSRCKRNRLVYSA